MDSRPTVAEIDLSALRHNFIQLQRVLPAGCGILAVVKADPRLREMVLVKNSRLSVQPVSDSAHAAGSR